MDKQNVVYVNTMKYYSAVKTNEVLMYAPAWMNHENMVF